jgi:hypothetical protein
MLLNIMMTLFLVSFVVTILKGPLHVFHDYTSIIIAIPSQNNASAIIVQHNLLISWLTKNAYTHSISAI